MCDNPFYVQYTDYCGIKRTVPCPCCKCPSCLKDHRNGWMIRLYEESKCWRYVRFITLTYNELSVPRVVNPVTGELVTNGCLADVSSTFKRFRTNYTRVYGYKPDFKYFICLEYGPNRSKRPHYHGLVFFDFDPKRFGLFLDDWSSKKGFVLDKPVGNENIDKQRIVRYVSKYITKQEYCSRKDDILDGAISRPSFIMSKGIGASYVSRMYDYHRNCTVETMVDRMFYTFDGKVRYPLPKFYKERFYKKLKTKIQYEGFYNEDFTAFSLSCVRTVKRYTSECLLSVAIGDVVRARRLSDFYKSVRFEESCGTSRFEAIAKTRLHEIENRRIVKVANSQSLADELRLRYFTDHHSAIPLLT